MNVVLILTVILLVKIADCGFADNDAGLDFDFEDDVQPSSQNTPAHKEQALQETLLRAMRKPAVREQIGQVIPILRAMSPQQRLTLAALVSAQIMAPQHADQQNIKQVASLFGAPGESTRNVSEKLLLPISIDIAKIFRGIAGDAGRSWRSAPPARERRPTSGQSYRPDMSALVPSAWDRRSTIPRRPDISVTVPPTPHTFNFTVSKGSVWKSTTVGPNDINRRSDIDEHEESPHVSDCEYFTSDMCLEVSQYPEAEIMASIKKQQPLMESFLSEFGDVHGGGMGDIQPRIQRRRDGNDLGSGEGYMCPSSVKYAKPKRARTTSGLWKFVVNTGEYTQTLRLEMCTKPGASCSYLNDNFRSVCNQVYNYHRLMSWDEKRGLHMDVFKVPSCCSCHVQGYTTRLPPNDYPFAEKRKEVLPIGPPSSSGVKREIPRPGRPGASTQFQNIHSHVPPKELNTPSSEFSIEQSISEYHHYPPVQSQSIVTQNNFVGLDVQPTTQSIAFPQNTRLRPQQQSQQHPHPPKLHQQLPQFPASNFNFNRPQNSQNLQKQPPTGFPQRPHFTDVHESGSIKNTIHTPVGLVDHLVPPGPPLLLEHEKTPVFDNRRRNFTTNRYQEGQHIDKNFNNKIPMLSEEAAAPISPIPVPMHERTSPPSVRFPEQPRPTPSQTQENNRVTFKPAENQIFGSKLHTKPPQRPNRPVFVTPTPSSSDTRGGLDSAIKITPKPYKKFPSHPSKKINYNYHPIIDFFSRDAHLTDRQFHVQSSHRHHQKPKPSHIHHEVKQQQSQHHEHNVFLETDSQHRQQKPFHHMQQNMNIQQDIRLHQQPLERHHQKTVGVEPANNQHQLYAERKMDSDNLQSDIVRQPIVQNNNEWTPML